MEPPVIKMLSLNLLEGTPNGLDEMNSIFLSQSAAKSIFGGADPIGKIVKLDNSLQARVTGIYRDLSSHCSFGDLQFIAPWDLMIKGQGLDKILHNPWGASWFQTFVQIADHADMNHVSATIKDAKGNSIGTAEAGKNKPAIFLHPMSKWHLYAEFKNGVNTGGRILYVWLFAIIGIFVLILACINFMNLSTARSVKRAKEVGVRKTMGSRRSQLVYQFFTESVFVAFFSLVLALILVQLSLPLFDALAGSAIHVPWTHSVFWLACLGFTFLTGLLAGSYPAIYLSAFKPIKVLRSSFRVGRLAGVPRKLLVGMQFTVSIVLIIGTILVFRQIQYARNRPVGYDNNGLVMLSSHGIGDHTSAFSNDLLQTGLVKAVAQSELPVTNTYLTNSGFDWRGKDPALQEEFVTLAVSPEFGATIGWQMPEGRNFDSDLKTDSSAIILNEAAVSYLGFKDPVGQTILWGNNRPMHVIGVVKNMVTQNPYDPIKQTFFYLRPGALGTINIKVNPHVAMNAALAGIRKIFEQYSKDEPFAYQFSDQEYARKFSVEEQVGQLATSFSILAVFISCLGLFGMASFMAEQRIKEIGIRKVLGASVFTLWGLLSQEFLVLVFIALLIASPAAWYFMDRWLQNFQYRSTIPFWVFAVTAIGVILLTLLTISYQSIKAALMNPVKSLRSE